MTVLTKTTLQRIAEFNFLHAPFYLGADNYEEEGFTLNLDIPHMAPRAEEDDVPIESDFYCQDTFDLFSLEREGANRCGRQFLHGDGYEWGAVFLAAFAENDNIDEVELDCQLERFTVRSWDLQTLADLGAHFQEICEDEEEFKNLVFETLA